MTEIITLIFMLALWGLFGLVIAIPITLINRILYEVFKRVYSETSKKNIFFVLVSVWFFVVLAFVNVNQYAAQEFYISPEASSYLKHSPPQTPLDLFLAKLVFSLTASGLPIALLISKEG